MIVVTVYEVRNKLANIYAKIECTVPLCTDQNEEFVFLRSGFLWIPCKMKISIFAGEQNSAREFYGATFFSRSKTRTN